MQSQFVLFVAFAFIGCALSAAVESAPKSLDAAPLNSSPERKNDLLVAADEAQPEGAALAEAEGDSSDLDSSATHHRSYRRAYYGGYGGYPYGGYGGYGYSSYPSYGYGHNRGYYGSYPSYGYNGGYYGGSGYYGGYYPRHGYGGYGGYGHHRHGYYY